MRSNFLHVSPVDQLSCSSGGRLLDLVLVAKRSGTQEIDDRQIHSKCTPGDPRILPGTSFAPRGSSRILCLDRMPRAPDCRPMSRQGLRRLRRAIRGSNANPWHWAVINTSFAPHYGIQRLGAAWSPWTLPWTAASPPSPYISCCACCLGSGAGLQGTPRPNSKW